MACGGCCAEGCGLCCFACCCPCLAFKEAADNVGSDNGIIYCLVTFPLGFGCCALTVLADEVAKKNDVDLGIATAAVFACLDPCCCLSCRILHESRVYKAKGVTAEKMER